MATGILGIDAPQFGKLQAAFLEGLIGLKKSILNARPAPVPSRLSKHLTYFFLVQTRFQGVTDIPLQLPHVTPAHESRQDAHHTLFGTEVGQGPHLTEVVPIH